MKPNTVGQTPAALPLGGPVTSPIPPSRAKGGTNPDAGIPSGTVVLTLKGEMPVQDIAPGDRIITRNGGAVPLLRHDIATVTVPAVRVRAGSLGDTRPESDTTLPSAQGVLLRDWRARAIFGQPQAVAPAGVLVDDEFITDIGKQDLVLHHLVFERDQVVYAGGLELLAPASTSAMVHAA